MGALPTTRPKTELLNRVTGGGLSVSYAFTRTISILSSRSVSVELSFSNFSDQPVNNLHISNKVDCLYSGQFDFIEPCGIVSCVIIIVLQAFGSVSPGGRSSPCHLRRSASAI